MPGTSIKERPTTATPAAERSVTRSVPVVSVVIPAKNEEGNIGWVLRRLPDCVDEVVLVDGDSTDRTVEIALAVRPDVVVVPEAHRGKGAALRTGFAAARGDLIVMFDADCSMDPGEAYRFVAQLIAGADLVKGSRFLAGGGTADMTPLRYAGNRVLLSIVNLVFGSSFTDLCYGYMGFRRAALEALSLEADGFEIETEIVARSLRLGMAVAEVPSFESARRCGASNLRVVRDGLRIARTISRERVRRIPQRPPIGERVATMDATVEQSTPSI